MPVTIPTVSALRDQIIADIEGKLGTTVPLLTKAAFRVLATAYAGALALLYRVARWVYAQIFPQTAEAEALALIAERYGITRNAAVRAKMTATATGTTGTLIPAGTLWTGGGMVYEQEAAVAIIAGTATITVECLTSGDAGNLLVGATITAASPIAGMDSTATIASSVIEGEDEEAIEDLRTRVIARMQNQPQGGAAADYVGWAREVPGIVKAFAYNTGPGYVTVYPLEAVTGASRIPGGAKITEVENYVASSSRRTLCATVLADVMTELAEDVTITGMLPGDAGTRAAVEADITAYLYAAYPAQYADEVNPTNVVSAAAIWAIIAAHGAVATDVTLSLGVNYTLDDDEIVALGAMTWA